MGSKFKFKCCSNKSFFYYCCVTCSNIFHPSCLERDFRSHAKLSEQKIYCSTQCKRAYESDQGPNPLSDVLDKLELEIFFLKIQLTEKNDELERVCIEKDEIIHDLREEINEMQSDLNKLQHKIVRDRKKTLDFEDEVFESEKQLQSALNAKREEVVTLRNSLTEYTKEKSELIAKLELYKEKQTKFEKDLEDLNGINKSMIDSIRILELDNNSYYNEICLLKSEVNELTSKRVCFGASPHKEADIIITSPPRQDIEETKEGIQPTNILLLGDQTVKHLSRPLRRSLGDNVFIQTITKPNASYRNILDNLPSLVKDFTENDYVIIGCGTNDLSVGKYPSIRFVHNIIKLCLNTNIVFLSCPVIVGRFYHNVKYFNYKLGCFLDYVDRFVKNRILLLDICNEGGTKFDNFKITKSLSTIVNTRVPKLSNLIHIACSSGDEKGDPPVVEEVRVSTAHDATQSPHNVSVSSAAELFNVSDDSFLG